MSKHYWIGRKRAVERSAALARARLVHYGIAHGEIGQGAPFLPSLLIEEGAVEGERRTLRLAPQEPGAHSEPGPSVRRDPEAQNDDKK